MYDEVVAQIRPDAEQFLRWCGKRETFWHWPEDVATVNAQVMAG